MLNNLVINRGPLLHYIFLSVFALLLLTACGDGLTGQAGGEEPVTDTSSKRGIDAKPISGKGEPSLSTDERSSILETPRLVEQITREVTEKEPTPKVVLKPFNPLEDGFGFANFSGGSGSSTILVNDLVDLFGSDGLCSLANLKSVSLFQGYNYF